MIIIANPKCFIHSEFVCFFFNGEETEGMGLEFRIRILQGNVRSGSRGCSLGFHWKHKIGASVIFGRTLGWKVCNICMDCRGRLHGLSIGCNP